MLLSIAPWYAVVRVVGHIKGSSTIHIVRMGASSTGVVH